MRPNIIAKLITRIHRMRRPTHGGIVYAPMVSYEEAQRRWENGILARFLLREWDAGNLVVKTPRKRVTDGPPAHEITHDEIGQAFEKGVELDDVFFARGQYSLEKLWTDRVIESRGKDRGR